MATYLAVPLKKTYEVELVKPLKNFIKATYTSINSDDYEQALKEFAKLRASMIAKSSDKHESALAVLCRFVTQVNLQYSKVFDEIVVNSVDLKEISIV